MKIVVLDGYTLNPGDNPWTELEKLGQLTVHDRTGPADIVSRAADAEIVLTNKTPLRREHLERLPKLRFIAVLATGYNIVDVDAARSRNIPVANVPAYGTDSVAQHVMALLLELSNSVGLHSRTVAAGEWAKCPDFCYWHNPIVELRGLNLGIVGFGRIGRRVADLGHALGMNILVAQRDGKAADGDAPAPYPLRRLPFKAFFAEADVVSLHCKQTDDNLRFVNRAVLESMKKTSYLINTARGTLIDEADLARALAEGRIAGAALDVLSVEPPDPANPLLRAPRCIVTPHIAWSSDVARRRLMKTAADNVAAFLRGEARNVVN